LGAKLVPLGQKKLPTEPNQSGRSTYMNQDEFLELNAWWRSFASSSGTFRSKLYSTKDFDQPCCFAPSRFLEMSL